MGDLYTENSFRDLLDNMLEGFQIIGFDWRYLYVNNAAAALAKVSKEALVGRNVMKLNPGIEQTALFTELKKCMDERKPGRMESEFVFLDGRKGWFELNIQPVSDGIFILSNDITERKQVGDALKASQKLAEELYESAPDALMTVNVEGRITRVNAQALAIFGYARAELLNLLIETLIPLHLQESHKFSRRDFFANPRVREMGTGIELSALKKDGTEFPVEIKLSPLQMDGETFVTAAIRDITERKQMDQALRHRTNMTEALTQAMLDLINRHEMDDILQTLLLKVSVLLDAPVVTFDLLENNDTLVLYAGTSNQPLKQGDAISRGEGEWLSWKVVETGEPIILEDYATWSKRRPLYEGYEIHATMIVPIHLRERVIGVIDCARTTPDRPFNDTDIFAAKQLAQMVALVLDNANLYSQLQANLKESIQREESLRATQAQVVDQQRAFAMLEERQRMARDLHDSVSQSIHSLMLFSETLVSTLEKNNVERARQISERLQESARQALKETRLLLYQSQVSVKERDVNLIEELNARLSNVELRAGVRAQIIQEGSLEYCPTAWYENLFWITIEALNNSLKHAQARSVQICIRCFPHYVELEVSDNGKGFDISDPGVGGYGLRTMQERANLLGSSLTFTSDPEKGTTVLFRAEIKEPT